MEGLNLEKMNLKTKFNPLTSVTIPNPRFAGDKEPVGISILEKYSYDTSSVEFVDINLKPITGEAHDYFQSSYGTRINAFFGFIEDTEADEDVEQTEEQKLQCQIIAVDDVDEFEEISPGHKEQDPEFLELERNTNSKQKYMKKFPTGEVQHMKKQLGRQISANTQTTADESMASANMPGFSPEKSKFKNTEHSQLGDVDEFDNDDLQA